MSAIPEKKPHKTTSIGPLFDVSSTTEMLSETHTQELVIALCGPMGSPLHEVGEKIKEMLLGQFSYEHCQVIRLSGLIEAHAQKAGRPIGPGAAKRRTDLIAIGDEMRQSYGHAVLAELAVRDIRRDRQENGMEQPSGRYLPRRVCHIIDSIKNEAELELLKTVYRETLYIVGVFSPVSNREASLKQKGLTNTEVAELMDKDSGEEKPEGQMVSDIFPQCDFFLRMDSNTSTQLNARVERFLNLVLGAQIVTPTRAEMAMYAAASAATNSACLSRQVGAAVTDANGDLLATGWNDVPKAFGDLYVTDLKGDPTNIHDKRCWNYGGKCYNDEEKTLLAEHIVQTLEHVLPPGKRDAAIQAVMADKKLRGLIEFSRSIHAEMHAILTALRLEGDRVRGGQLFVTTYPCHSCARHIIAAGIKEVYYIEPYKKSLVDLVKKMDSSHL
jgi:deoxycytidylate deaminase